MQRGKGLTEKPDQTKQTPQPKTPPTKEAFASSETNDGVHTEQVVSGLRCELAGHATPRAFIAKRQLALKLTRQMSKILAATKTNPSKQTKTTKPQNKNNEQKHHRRSAHQRSET